MKLLEKILLPISLNDISKFQLETALKLADKFKSKLILAYVMPEDAKKVSVKPLIDKYIDSSYSQILKNHNLTELQAEKQILYGNKVDQILSAAENENVNLILISNDFEQTNNKDNIDVLAEKLIRKSQKPVWVVKEGSTEFPQKILCSVDYSDPSERALTNAIKIARTFRAKLIIINVFEPMEENYSLRFEIDSKLENQKNENKNEKRFGDFLGRFNFVDVEYETHILKGSPETEILKFIRQDHIDLLFMGATGKTFIQRIFLGSVTEKVIRELPCSMVITKSKNILNLTIDADISDIEKHMANAHKLEETGYYKEAIEQLKICLRINDLHLPALNGLVKLYSKIGETDSSNFYHQKIDEILKRLWDKKIEEEIRKSMKL